MLHELAHNVHGPHDAKFHALWNQLRDEHEGLVMKGYTGEGFLSEGHRLGGRRGVPREEAQRLARAAAEKRRVLQAGSGQRLGGAPIRPGQDVRRVIADAAERPGMQIRNTEWWDFSFKSSEVSSSSSSLPSVNRVSAGEGYASNSLITTEENTLPSELSSLKRTLSTRPLSYRDLVMMRSLFTSIVDVPAGLKENGGRCPGYPFQMN